MARRWGRKCLPEVDVDDEMKDEPTAENGDISIANGT